MRRVAVIDSPALINLAHLGLASKLAIYFTVVYVPRRVQTEVNKKTKFRHRLNKLYHGDFFKGATAPTKPAFDSGLPISMPEKPKRWFKLRKKALVSSLSTRDGRERWRHDRD